MRVAALYDIHGNLPALESVLDDVRAAGVERVVVGGDVVPGPMPHECLALLRALDVPVQYIQGNGDRETLVCFHGECSDQIPAMHRGTMRWNAAQLDADDARFVGSWPKTLRLPVPGVGDVLFCHATPRSDTEIFTRRTRDETLAPLFEGLDVPLVVCGHTHMQFDRRIGATRVVNAGSVGMPFGEPGAYWLLLGPDVELRRTTYDLARAAERVRATRYPHAEQFAEHNVLHPPSEQSILATFAKAELR